MLRMVDLPRKLDLLTLLPKKSFFLFGPRSTGKSHLIRQQLKDRAVVIDLLQSDILLRLSSRPEDLEAMIDAGPAARWIVLDEIQRVPSLLPEVHRLIEARRLRFLLTGSSARKLRRGSSDLLAGRAWVAHLFPLSWAEIPGFDLHRYLRFGGLPQVYLGESPQEELRAYVSVYLQEEIRAEGIIRRLPPFTRFLRVAALSSGQLLNYAQVASDAEVAPSTVREYFSVLEDTLVGWTLEPWRESRKRKAIQTAKFYLLIRGSRTNWREPRPSTATRTCTDGASSSSSAWSCAPTRVTPAPASRCVSGVRRTGTRSTSWSAGGSRSR